MSTWGRRRERQRFLNAFRMKCDGGNRPCGGWKTDQAPLKRCCRCCVWAWMADPMPLRFGPAVGPHPYPTDVHEFQKVIVKKFLKKRQIWKKKVVCRIGVIACKSRWWPNAIGAFLEYVAEEEVGCWGRSSWTWLTRSTRSDHVTKGTIGVVDGMKTYAVFGEDGKAQRQCTDLCWFGLPRLVQSMLSLKILGRVEYVAAMAMKQQSSSSSVRQKGSSCHWKPHAIKEGPTLQLIKTRSLSSTFPTWIAMWPPSPIIS